MQRELAASTAAWKVVIGTAAAATLIHCAHSTWLSIEVTHALFRCQGTTLCGPFRIMARHRGCSKSCSPCSSSTRSLCTSTGTITQRSTSTFSPPRPLVGAWLLFMARCFTPADGRTVGFGEQSSSIGSAELTIYRLLPNIPMLACVAGRVLQHRSGQSSFESPRPRGHAPPWWFLVLGVAAAGRWAWWARR